MIHLLFLLAGIVLLVAGANLLVAGASSIGKKLNISELVIGLTIVAFGTSTPELVVNIIAGVSGNTGIAMGNIMGSNIANIFIILGISALIRPIPIRNSTIRIEIPFSLLAAALVWVTANDQLIDRTPDSVISRIDGLILLAFFGIFLYYTFFSSSSANDDQSNSKIRMHPLWKSAGFVMLGLLLLYAGGEVIVSNAVRIARQLNIPEEIIGLTIVAIGTSLPELATSIAAAFRGNTDIAIGNVVGSNIFNIFFILGITSVIRPIPFLPAYHADMAMMMGGSLLLMVFMLTGKKSRVDPWEGLLFLAVYLIYMAFRIL